MLLPLVRKSSLGYFIALANLTMVEEQKVIVLSWEATIVLMLLEISFTKSLTCQYHRIYSPLVDRLFLDHIFINQ